MAVKVHCDHKGCTAKVTPLGIRDGVLRMPEGWRDASVDLLTGAGLRTLLVHFCPTHFSDSVDIIARRWMSKHGGLRSTR